MDDSVSQENGNCEGNTCPGTVSRTWYCIDCVSSYCEVCWPKQGPHKAGKVGRDERPHEQSEKRVVDALRSILNPKGSVEELRKAHVQDEETAWYTLDSRLRYDRDGQLIEEWYSKDNRRFSSLAAESGRSLSGEPVYPHLISFVGETDAGKSTLIKILLTLDTSNNRFRYHTDHQSPVVGSAKHDKVPTSGDIHLFADPSTYETQSPHFYADCEGITGGSKEPLAKQARKTVANETRHGPLLNIFHRPIEKPLQWIKDDKYKRSRGFLVKEFFPRLMYTFSDAMVFVMKTAKTFESGALSLLLQWAAKHIDKALNQPFLPKAIIVFNQTDMGVDESEWDPSAATASLLQQIRNDVKTDPGFKEFAKIWRSKGYTIDTTEDLIKRYYSSISVVRIPVKGRYQLLANQVNKLRHEIQKACEEAYYAKLNSRLLANADDMDIYLNDGFDHFSRKLDEPFNFMEVNIKNNPIPKDLSDHILNLAVAASDKSKPAEAPRALEDLSPYVASTLHWECVRNGRPGSIKDVFKGHYSRACKAVLEKFCNEHCRCVAKDSRGRSCQNFKSTHLGHQNAKGQFFDKGSYKAAFDVDTFLGKWTRSIEAEMTRIDEEYQSRRRQALMHKIEKTSRAIAFELHQEHVSRFFEKKQDKFKSLLTCYCCLTQLPVHALKCGHAFCTTCIMDLGRHQDSGITLIDTCPMEPNITFHPPWAIWMKPEHAGVRVLTLDGGGIRGIVELEILQRLKEALGGQLEIHKFFDLIVGTSTGGIIALGLAAKQWSVETCKMNFLNTCDQAFSPRLKGPIKAADGARKFVAVTHGSIYRTSPLYKALFNALGNRHLYGGRQSGSYGYATRVAAMTTSGTGHEAIVLTNYSRHEHSRSPYRLEFSDGKDPGLKVWQAAAATSAAPGYFIPFKNDETGRSYMDGGLYYNNPARVAFREQQMIWRDVSERPPDLFLSLGTGHNLADTEQSIREGKKSTRPSDLKRNAVKVGEAKPGHSKQRKVLHNFASHFVKTLMSRIEKVLDSELLWNEFATERLGPSATAEDSQRYVRLNPDLGGACPRLDAKHKTGELSTVVNQYLDSWEITNLVRRISFQLVASSFYLDCRRVVHNEEKNEYTVSSRLRCRFPDGSDDLRFLGHFLKGRQTAAQRFSGNRFQPFFRICEQQGKNRSVLLFEQALEPKVINDMIDFALFNRSAENAWSFPVSSVSAVSQITMFLDEADEAVGFPISGFPRPLVQDELDSDTADKASGSKSSLSLRHKLSQHRSNTSLGPTSTSAETPPVPDLPITLSPERTRSASDELSTPASSSSRHGGSLNTALVDRKLVSQAASSAISQTPSRETLSPRKTSLPSRETIPLVQSSAEDVPGTGDISEEVDESDDIDTDDDDARVEAALAKFGRQEESEEEADVSAGRYETIEPDEEDDYVSE